MFMLKLGSEFVNAIKDELEIDNLFKNKAVRITAPTSSCLGGWDSNADRSFPCNTLDYKDANFFTAELISNRYYKITVLKTGMYLVVLNSGKENSTTGSVTYLLARNNNKLSNAVWDLRLFVSTTGYSNFQSASGVIQCTAGDYIVPIAYGDTTLQCDLKVTLVYLGN